MGLIFANTVIGPLFIVPFQLKYLEKSRRHFHRNKLGSESWLYPRLLSL